MSKPETQRVMESWGNPGAWKATVACLTCGHSQTVEQEEEGFAIDQWPCECGDAECRRRVCRNCPECDRCGLRVAPECTVQHGNETLCRDCMRMELEDAAASAAEVLG